MRIAIVGSGYVGLVTAACLAQDGHDVTAIDRDVARIAALERGETPIFEPGLCELIAKGRAAGRLRFSANLACGVAGAAAIFIAVGTPARSSDGRPDLGFVLDAVRAVADASRGFVVVVGKSTVPAGVGDRMEDTFLARRPTADFAVVSNPEFLREGSAIKDFRRPDRIVIGVEDERARRVMAEIYRPFAQGGVPILYTRRRTAELAKYAANAFLAMKLAFINEMADVCEAADADVDEVAQAIGLDRRIGSHFLQAGPGFGGSCFPKDTLALARSAQDLGAPSRLVEATIAANEDRKRAMADKVAAACGGTARGRRIAVLGLAFKPGTDDLRESPALAVVEVLKSQGAEIVAYDPQVPAAVPGVSRAPEPYAAAEGADALVVATDWPEFRTLDFARIGRTMRRPTVVDLRNLLDPDRVTAAGLVYVGLGGRGAALRPPRTLAAE